MASVAQPTALEFGAARVRIYPSRHALGAAAALDAARISTNAVRERGRARIIVATGNSQLELIGALVEISACRGNQSKFSAPHQVAQPGSDQSGVRRLWREMGTLRSMIRMWRILPIQSPSSE
jgi:hypothetical protein